MIKCTDDTNALENALINDFTKEGTDMLGEGVTKEIKHLRDEIQRINYDLDIYQREIIDNGDDIKEIDEQIKDIKDGQLQDCRWIQDIHDRLEDVQQILLVLVNLAVDNHKLKIDMDDYPYYRDAMHLDDDDE